MGRVIIVYILATCFGLLVQSLIHSNLSLSPVAPDLILVLVLELALDFPGIGGLLGAFCLGLFADTVSGRLLGPGAAGTVVAFYFFYFFSKRVPINGYLSVGIFCFLGTLVKSLVNLGMISIVANQFSLDWRIIEQVLIESALTGLVGPVVIALLQRSAGSGLSYLRISRTTSGRVK